MPLGQDGPSNYWDNAQHVDVNCGSGASSYPHLDNEALLEGADLTARISPSAASGVVARLHNAVSNQPTLNQYASHPYQEYSYSSARSPQSKVNNGVIISASHQMSASVGHLLPCKRTSGNTPSSLPAFPSIVPGPYAAGYTYQTPTTYASPTPELPEQGDGTNLNPPIEGAGEHEANEERKAGGRINSERKYLDGMQESYKDLEKTLKELCSFDQKLTKRGVLVAAREAIL
jgi:hypothetical protein